MTDWPFMPLPFERLTEAEMQAQSSAFLTRIRQRRTVREFSDQAVPREIIENAIRAAGSAPSGANMQPWHFEAVSDPAIKTQIREGAEAEERELYRHRASEEWLKALEPLATDENKPFLETAPWLITVFLKKFTHDEQGRRYKNYYTQESVGIACGFLLAALHWSGLATLTHTPSPMKFLNGILERPGDERPYMLIVTGYPDPEARVPVLEKYPLEKISRFR